MFLDRFVIRVGISLLSLPGVATADIFSDPYIGGGYTISRHGTIPISLDYDTHAILDDRAIGSVVYAGIKAYKIIGIELDYKQFGKHNGIVVTDEQNTFVSDYWMSLSAVNLSISAYLISFADNKATLFGRFGLGDVNITDMETEYRFSKDWGAFSLGVGGEYRMRNNFLVRADYTFYILSFSYTSSQEKQSDGTAVPKDIEYGVATSYSSLGLSVGYLF